jgi:thiol-disulfide isomerase/thioredoxin
MKQFLLLTTALLILFSSCGGLKGTKVSGKLTGASELSIFLDKVGMNTANNMRLAAEKTDKDGSFKFSIPDGIKKGVYKITVGAQALEFIVDGTEKDIVITGDLAKMNSEGFDVKGSPLCEKYMATVKSAIKGEIDVNGLKTLAEKDADPLVAFMIATRLFNFREEFADIHTKVAARLKATNIDFAEDYDQMTQALQQQAARKAAMEKVKLGMEAPEIALPGIDGKIKKLSDYKGKTVLIDFWASWCGPCRKANPHVVQLYEKYSSKGFEVFSVSLDGLDDRTREALAGDKQQLNTNLTGSKERWIQAIAQDNLKWKGHVSDLKKWNSAAAATYGVSSIPKTYLVGKDGKIVAVDPRNNLEEEILKNI